MAEASSTFVEIGPTCPEARRFFQCGGQIRFARELSPHRSLNERHNICRSRSSFVSFCGFRIHIEAIRDVARELVECEYGDLFGIDNDAVLAPFQSEFFASLKLLVSAHYQKAVDGQIPCAETVLKILRPLDIVQLVKPIDHLRKPVQAGEPIQE
jgi:hypothetical protein